MEIPTETASADTGSGTARWSSKTMTSLRFVLSVLIAVALCEAAWQLVPTTLSISTPIVGTPTFDNFDFPRYFDAFDLIAVVFPLLVLALYQVVSRIGPLQSPRVAGRLFPLRSVEADFGRSTREADSHSWVSNAFRLLLPAVVIAIEVSAGSSDHASTLTGLGVAVGAAYVALVVVLAGVSPLAGRVVAFEEPSYESRLNAVSALAMAVVVPLCLLVSSTTGVTVADPAHVALYPWLPWWLATAATVALLSWVFVRVRRAANAPALDHVEGVVLVVVVGVLALFLLLASLPGALPSFVGFDDAQYLAGAQLTFTHGLLPWRDLYLIHGMIEDVFDGQFGFSVFSHSRWGALAGQSVVIYPVAFCVYYFYVAYFARRNRLAVAVVALVILLGETTAVMRFAYLPLMVMLFDKLLQYRRRWLCAAFAFLTVLEAILTPEIVLMGAGLFATLVVFEVTTRSRGTGWGEALFRVRWTAAFGALFGGLWLVYLLATGSLGGFVDYYRVFGSNHALWGAFPLGWSLTGDPSVTVLFALPVALELATIWRFALKIRTRQAFVRRDWAMLASASFVLLYFQKGLDRPDPGHVVEVFTVCTPLVLLWGIELLDRCDEYLSWAARWARHVVADGRGAAKRSIGWLAEREHIAGVLSCVLLVLVGPGIFTTIRTTPGRLHASSPTDPPLPLLGYTAPGAVNTTEITTLGKILDAYAPNNAPVYDFANDVGVTYFLLSRVPGVRFFDIEEAQTLGAQAEAISELNSARPRLVIFTDSDFGLPTVDGIIGPVRNYLVSQYLLAHYAPFAEEDGQLVMIRDDLVHKVPPVSSLHLPGVVKGYRGLYFTSFSCDWGYVPNFLTPQPTSSAVAVPLSGGALINTEITGWAVDDKRKGPVRTVVAVSAGKVIGEAHPNIYRLDIQNYFGSQAGWTSQQAASVRNSGFVLTLHTLPKQPVQVYAVNADGSVTRIIPTPPPGPKLNHGLAGRVHVRQVTFDGKMRPVESGGWLSGWLNASQSLNERVYTLRFPPSVNLAPFPLLQMSSSGVIGSASFTLGDIPYDGNHAITFKSLPRAGSHLAIPVGSCLQWHGYSGPLQLIEQGGQPLVAVRAAR